MVAASTQSCAAAGEVHIATLLTAQNRSADFLLAVILSAAPALSEAEGKDLMAIATAVLVEMARGPSLRSGRQDGPMTRAPFKRGWLICAVCPAAKEDDDKEIDTTDSRHNIRHREL